MSHPSAGELLEFHFGEKDAHRSDALGEHVRGCTPCRGVLADVEGAERMLGAGPDASPPTDGLARVLARIETVRPAREQRAHWLRAAAPSAAAALAGALAVHQGGFGAALAFFGVGAILTLAIAPVLILESQRRS